MTDEQTCPACGLQYADDFHRRAHEQAPQLSCLRRQLAQKDTELAELASYWKGWHRELSSLLGCRFVESTVTREAVEALLKRTEAAEAVVNLLPTYVDNNEPIIQDGWMVFPDEDTVDLKSVHLAFEGHKLYSSRAEALLVLNQENPDAE